MLRIRKAQNEELNQRAFRSKLYRFLCEALPASHRARVGSLADVSALWARVPWIDDASEHNVAVYLTFVWVATFDPEAARRIMPPAEAMRLSEAALEMKSYMADAGLIDICAFDGA